MTGASRAGDPRRQRPAVYQLSIDTGSTFTDGYVTGPEGSAQVKVDSTPSDPTEGFADCVAAAAAAMGETAPGFLARCSLIHFSSTIATNIVVQRAGAQIGLIVSAGHEHDLYGSADDARLLSGFVDPAAVRGVAEAVAEDGTLAREVDAAGLEAAVRELLDRGSALVVISFARSHLNPVSELAARALIEASYPRHYLGAIPLLLSSQLSLEPDDYGRTALAVANAYLHPALARSLYRAEDRLREQKFRHPLLVVNTDGSSTRVAKTRAIDTFNSGPAAGVFGAAVVAGALQFRHVVTLDVGGTTTDVAYIGNASVPLDAATVFGDVAVPHPAVSLCSFGLGGGSVIAARPGGRLVAGPRSAGGVPGPACFGLGGSEPTPTDAWLALGYLEPGEFLSGRRRLDPGGAQSAFAQLARELGIGVDEAALAALDVVHATLAGHLQAWAAGQPFLTASEPADRALFCYGGGGGLLAVPAAAALGIGRVVVFPHSAVFSAFGCGLLPIAHAYRAPVADVCDTEAVGAAITRALDLAARDMRAEGAPDQAGIAAELTLRDFTGQQGAAASPRALALHGPAPSVALGGASRPGMLAVRIRADREATLRPVGSPAGHVRSGPRLVRTRTGAIEVPVSAGLGRPCAPAAAGPVFLDAPDTTIFVPAGWTAGFNSLGYGIVRRQAGRG